MIRVPRPPTATLNPPSRVAGGPFDPAIFDHAFFDTGTIIVGSGTVTKTTKPPRTLTKVARPPSA